MYLRTEVRFYNEVVPLLSIGGTSLGSYLPKVHHAEYDLSGLVPEDCPATHAKQPSPFPEDNEDAKNELLHGKGGHILLESLSPSHGNYFQDSPITKEHAAACLAAVAELHASAWGDVPLLQTVHDRLSDAGGSYMLRFRNPKELQNMVSSWEHFRAEFAGEANPKADVLKKESVINLGRRMRDMAEYISAELSPGVKDEYATMVHGDYKAMVRLSIL